MRALLNRLHRLIARWRLGVLVALKVRNQCSAIIGYHLAPSPDPERNGEQWLMRAFGREIRTFMDVGAHRGRWTGLLLEHAGRDARGLLFEPNAECLPGLRSRFERQPSLEVRACALGAAVGELPFRAEPGLGERSRIVVGGGAPGDRPVSVSTIDQEIGASCWDGVDLVKIDAEGYDLHVLRGGAGALSRGRLGIVQFEYGDRWPESGSTLLAALGFLGAFGYRTYLLQPDGLAPVRYERWGEHFSYSNYVAISPGWHSRAEPWIRP